MISMTSGDPAKGWVDLRSVTEVVDRRDVLLAVRLKLRFHRVDVLFRLIHRKIGSGNSMTVSTRLSPVGFAS